MATTILVERLVHYFNSYKWAPGKESTVSIGKPYGREHAERVVCAAMEDYAEVFPPNIHEGDSVEY